MNTSFCYTCETEFTWNPRDQYDRHRKFCDSCAASEISRQHSKAIEDALAKFDERTPIRILETDTEHPDFNVKLWERIHAWMPTRELPWLGLIGPHGRCKTRAVYLLLRKIIAAMIQPASDPESRPRAPHVSIVKAYRFSEAVADKAGDERAEAVNFLHKLRHAQLLFIDDLGKQGNTTAVSRELQALIDHRYDEKLPTIWTSNGPPEVFLSGMPDDLVRAISGRIREFSLIINLS